MIDRELYPDERDDNRVRCRICGRWVAWKNSRLFYGSGGTIRTCKAGDTPHGKPPATRSN